METNLKVTLRDSIGSAESRRLRNDGSIPAVIYGMGMDPVSVVLDAREFNNALRSETGANTILNLEVGKKKYTALAREIQKHPYRNEFLHVDLIQIDLTKTSPRSKNSITSKHLWCKKCKRGHFRCPDGTRSPADKLVKTGNTSRPEIFNARSDGNSESNQRTSKRWIYRITLLSCRPSSM